jgi:hypothetical protein
LAPNTAWCGPIKPAFKPCSGHASKRPRERLEPQTRTAGGVAGNGAYRDRTGDLRLAKPALSQLS